MSENFKNIDDLFREKFENFEQDPPEHVWEGVKAGIGSGGGPKGGLRGGIAGFTALLVIIGTMLVYLLSNSFTVQNDSLTESEESIGENIEIAVNQPAEIIPVIAAESKSTLPTENTGTNEEVKTGIKIQSNDFTQEAFPVEKIAKSSLVVERKIPAVSGDEHNEFKETYTNLNDLTWINFEEINLNEDQQNRLRLNRKSTDFGSTVPAETPVNYGPKAEWLLGLYFRPEMIRYPSDEKITNYSKAFDLHVQYKKNNLFFQTGLGYSRVKDAGNYTIDYNKFLGSYEDVYDVTYDTVGNQVIPTYHTQTVDIYDSVNYVRISPSERVFGYLDIPLLFGYGQEHRRFGWFVKAGPTISLLIHENVPAMNMGDDQFKILSVENSLPTRLEVNWQLSLSAGINYKLGNKLSLTVEPLMRYYIKSDYESGKFNTKHPYSLGLRTGLLMSF